MDPLDLRPVTVGRIVHYVMGSGEHRPAIIVCVWNQEAGTSNLQVFTDGSNDGKVNVVWETSITRSNVPKPYTWHWPEETA